LTRRNDLHQHFEQYAATRLWERVKALQPAEITDIRNRLWLAVEAVTVSAVSAEAAVVTFVPAEGEAVRWVVT